MIRLESGRFCSFTSSISDGCIESVLHSTSPRLMLSFLMPAKLTAARCPAYTADTSRPCTCKLRTRHLFPSGMSCASSPTAMCPSMSVPVTIVPKPSTENTRSMGRRNGVRALFSSACSVKSCSASRSASTPSPVRTDVRRIGLSSKNVPLTRLLTSSSSMFSQSSSTKSVFVSTMSPSFTPSSCRMSRCSTVCGMKPSSAATTSIARSTPPAPASMFLMNLSCPGTSTTLAQLPSGKSRRAKPRSIVMPRFFSSASRSVSTPVSALTSSVLPWST